MTELGDPCPECGCVWWEYLDCEWCETNYRAGRGDVCQAIRCSAPECRHLFYEGECRDPEIAEAEEALDRLVDATNGEKYLRRFAYTPVRSDARGVGA